MKTLAEFAWDGEDSVETHLQNKNYARVLELLETEGDNYPDYARMFTFRKIRMAAVLGDKTKVVNLLQTALDKGFCYPQMAFEPYGDDSLAIPDVIYKSSEFQQMLTAHNAAWQKMLDATESFHTTAEPEGIMQPPLVVGFHGNTSSGVLEFPMYQPLVEMGYRVVLPQSAQLWAEDRYTWGDWKNTEKQIAREWQLIQEKYTFSRTGIITVGYSKGGEVAVWSAMSSTIPATGVIAFGMGGRYVDEPENLEPFIASARERKMAFYFHVGTEDELGIPSSQKTSDYLRQQGLRVHLEIVEGLGHNYPQDMVAFWNRALTFIKA